MPVRPSRPRRPRAGHTPADRPEHLPDLTVAGSEAIAGLVLATFSAPLGAFTAVVVTHGVEDRDPLYRSTVCVLELDWSGTALPSPADLADAPPLRLTHHSHAGSYAHVNRAPTVPRGYVSVSVVEPPAIPRSRTFSPRWAAGYQLSLQRRWDSGDRGPDPRDITLAAADLAAMDAARPDVWRVKITDVETLDATDITARFPNVSDLSLRGGFGRLVHADALNGLGSLKLLSVAGLFEMAPSEVLDPTRVPRLEALYLHDVPADYATATRRAWRQAAGTGTTLEIRGARQPGWVAENRDNPLREWDTRGHISPARYRSAVALYKRVRDQVKAVVAEDEGPRLVTALERIGAEYAVALNKLDGLRSPFIETEEREDVFSTLEHMLAQTRLADNQVQTALAALQAGVESSRDW